MRWEQSIQYASRSDIGLRRKNNQDSFCVQTCSEERVFQEHGHLFVVADGMGGHAVGELASKIAVDTIPHAFFKSRAEDTTVALKTSILLANDNIHERGSQNPDFDRMGTTCSALVLSPQGAVIGHVGDSRVYRIRSGRIDQLTFDHSLQWELIRQGRMPADEVFLYEPRHVITRSLGPESKVDVDVEGPYVILPGDTYVLCSDGLTNHVNDPEIGMIAGELPPGEASRLLVNLSNLRGGSDNVTVVIARVGELPPGVEPMFVAPQEETQPALTWKWLAGFWGAAMSLVAGICLVLFSQVIAGLILGLLGAAGLAALTIRWTQLRKALIRTETAGDETVIWRPYASADARLDKRFLNSLAGIESELQRTAIEEKWPVEWDVHRQELESVKQSLSSNQRGQAFRALSRAINVLMTGLQEQRRQHDRERRWGRLEPAPTDSHE